jgi:hypothetical protein
MSTHELFKKHFGNQIAVDLKHPNMESFFEELNEECLQEDKHKKCNIQRVVRQFTCSCGIPDAIRLCEGVEYCMKCGDRLSK